VIQEIVAYGIGVLAVGWLALRWFRRRAAPTCCGEKTCPAVADAMRRLNDAQR